MMYAQDGKGYDLSSFFGKTGNWKPTRLDISNTLDSLNGLPIKKVNSKEELLRFLQVSRRLRSNSSKMIIYGILRSGADINDSEAKEIYQIGTSLESQIEAVLGTFENSIMGLPEVSIQEWSKDKSFTLHRRRLNRILATKKYALGAEATKILNSVKGIPRNSVDVFWALHGANLDWPKVIADGDTIIVNQQSYINVGNLKDIDKRDKSIKDLFQLLEKYEDVFGLLYYKKIQGDYILAKNQGFTSGMQAEWYKRDHIPKEGYENMLKALYKNKDVLKKYVALKSKILDRKMEYSDLFTIINLENQDYSLDNSLQMVGKIAKNYDKTFYEKIKHCMGLPWADIAYSETKENTYSVYPPVTGNPYFLFNYQPTHKHARALMGAYTLMAIWTDLPENALPENGDDPAVYSNGIIFLGDIMYDEYVSQNLAKNVQEKKLALINTLDFYWYYAIRWIIFSELDYFIEQKVIDNEFITGAEISQKYLSLLKEYFGENINIPDHFGQEWMLTHILFMSYEHQYWPASMAFAAYLLEMDKPRTEIASEIFLEVPKSTSYDRSYDILKAVDIDMTAYDVYNSLFKRMNKYIEELQNLE